MHEHIVIRITVRRQGYVMPHHFFGKCLGVSNDNRCIDYHVCTFILFVLQIEYGII